MGGGNGVCEEEVEVVAEVVVVLFFCDGIFFISKGVGRDGVLGVWTGVLDESKGVNRNLVNRVLYHSGTPLNYCPTLIYI